VTLVIGTDEAGYGPNLGPLVVAATAWRIEAGPEAVEDRLARALEEAGRLAPGGRLWGDSKLIYRGGSGFEGLERGVLVAVALAGQGLPASWRDLIAGLAADGSEPTTPPPEQASLEGLSLPRHQATDACPELAAVVESRLAAAGVCLEAVRCRLVQPAEFNQLLDEGLNKSDILSRITLELAARLAAQAHDEPVVIWCDRHGGRRRYAAQVARAFDAPLVQPLSETASSSRYACGASRTIEFSVAGESRLPVAVASMTAKYLRELSMQAFNGHWGSRQAGLKPTAGYPVDAVRWRAEGAAAVESAGTSWDAVWRRA